MKHRVLFILVTMLVLSSMILASCQAAKTPTTTAGAAPVKLTYKEVAFAPVKKEAPDCKYGGNFKAIEAVDQYTVKFTMCTADPAFLAKIAVGSFDILDTGYLQALGGDAAKINDLPVGTGPYYIKEWVRGDHITFEVNPTYWGTKPANKTFMLKWNKEAAARLLDLQSGNIDGLANLGTDDYTTVSKDTNLKLVPRVFNNFLYLGINRDTPPFDNEKVRQAIAFAINREKIVKDFYPTGASAATQFLPPGVKPGFTDGYVAIKYDTEKAKALLKEANFDLTKEYVLGYAERTRPYFPKPDAIAQAVQSQLGDVGIKIKLNKQEWATYLPRTRDGKEALFFLGWSEDYPDATNWYDVFLMGSSKAFGTAFPDIVDLIKKGATTGDAKARQAIYDQLNKLIDQHVPTTVIANGATAFAFSAKVKNVLIGPYNENYKEMVKEGSDRLVFSQDGEPVSLDCSDETDGSSHSACDQVFDKLYSFKFGTATAVPDLAEKCEPNTDATVWTCTIRKGVKFNNGAALDAGDVATTFIRAWDAKDPLHKGNTGAFQYYKDFFGPGLLNETK